jgi:hypothetical protein
MNKFIPWTEIKAFNNIKSYAEAYPEILNSNPIVEYQSKVKLHGINTAVRIVGDTITCQSRTQDISTTNDLMGFAKFVDSNKDKGVKIHEKLSNNVIIYGEWVGKGVQKNVALSLLEEKIFVVFAARIIGEEDSLLVDPLSLSSIVKDIPNVFVLPWYSIFVKIDFNNPESILKELERINKEVNAIDAEDPWVFDTFGVKSNGEGLVFYPSSKEHLNYKNFSNLCFKAKGAAHQTIAKAEPAQIDPSKANSIDEFVTLVLTEARLNQGANGSFEMKQIKPFLDWISADIIKECQDELKASNLTFDVVSKALTSKARSWYLEKSKQVK